VLEMGGGKRGRAEQQACGPRSFLPRGSSVPAGDFVLTRGREARERTTKRATTLRWRLQPGGADISHPHPRRIGIESLIIEVR
jgi:hypothetical protein